MIEIKTLSMHALSCGIFYPEMKWEICLCMQSAYCLWSAIVWVEATQPNVHLCRQCSCSSIWAWWLCWRKARSGRAPVEQPAESIARISHLFESSEEINSNTNYYYSEVDDKTRGVHCEPLKSNRPLETALTSTYYVFLDMILVLSKFRINFWLVLGVI